MNLQTLVDRPATVLYCFAPDAFIAKLGNKAKTIIAYKKTRQVKLLDTMSKNAGLSYNEGAAKVQNAFKDAYGMLPYDALKTLAAGGEVAGKNWAAGVYGIGAVKRNDYAQNAGVTVDQTTGKIMVNGVEAAGQTSIYSGSKVKSYVYTDESGNTYTSVRKTGGKYYANTYTAAGAEATQNANGEAVTSADAASIWNTIAECFSNFVTWLLSLFGVSEEETVTSTSTLASQSDGFIEEETGVGEAAMWAVLAVGAGIFLSGGLKPKRGKK